MSPLEVERVLAIAGEAAEADGLDHLDEAARLELAHRPASVSGVVNENGFAIVTSGTLALIVRPERRGQERARALLSRVQGMGICAAWSHGAHPAAAALAEEYGWRRDREVLRLTRPASPTAGSTERSVDPPTLRTFGRVRGFRPGDEAEILRVNAAAFAHHPEQGGLSLDGLGERMAEPWFDPADLLLWWEDDRLAALAWIKRIAAHPDEIYLFAVDPAFHGQAIGSALLEAALATMGDAQVYTDAGNSAARHLYEQHAGFSVAEVHAHYVRP